MGCVRARLSLVAVSGVVAFGGLTGCGGGNDDESGNTEVSGSDQEQVSQDAEAKLGARDVQTALEVYATDIGNNGSYAGATQETLAEIHPPVGELTLTLDAQAEGYELTVESESGNTFTVSRDASGMVAYSCETEGEGGCPDGGDWAGTGSP